MGETNFISLMGQSIAALALVLAIFAGLIWALKRLQTTTVVKQKGQLQVIQRLSLDAKNSVLEIQYGSQRYLLGVGQQGVQKIADVTPEATPACQSSTTQHDHV